MAHGVREHLRLLQGRRVGLALTDRSCIDDGYLLAVRGERVWLDASGTEVIVAVDEIVDVWEQRR